MQTIIIPYLLCWIISLTLTVFEEIETLTFFWTCYVAAKILPISPSCSHVEVIPSSLSRVFLGQDSKALPYFTYDILFDVQCHHTSTITLDNWLKIYESALLQYKISLVMKLKVLRYPCQWSLHPKPFNYRANNLKVFESRTSFQRLNLLLMLYIYISTLVNSLLLVSCCHWLVDNFVHIFTMILKDLGFPFFEAVVYLERSAAFSSQNNTCLSAWCCG